jgi:competence protein ComGC
MPHPPRTGHGALLIMVLIGIALILYLAFGNMGGTSYMQQVKQTKDKGEDAVRQISTQQMSILISMYREQNKSLPASPADLESPGAFNDPWGREMTFSFTTKNGRTIVTYHSAGRDGEPKTEDDTTYEDTLPY